MRSLWIIVTPVLIAILVAISITIRDRVRRFFQRAWSQLSWLIVLAIIGWVSTTILIVGFIWYQLSAGLPNWPEPIKKLYADMGGGPISFMVLCVSFVLTLYIKQKDGLRQTMLALQGALMPARHSDLFSGLFSHWGTSTMAGDQFKVSCDGNPNYITIHSEVLYYTMLCSLLDTLGNSVTALSRVNIFIPGGASLLFLPEILRVAPKPAVQNRYYVFRNDLLDYDRESLRDMGDDSQMHLWSVFAGASRILLRDSGARFGYFKAYSANRPSIWEEDFEWPEGYSNTCERFSIQRIDLPPITAIVQRDPTTFEFKQARIIVGDEAGAISEAGWPSTEAYFTRLKSHESHVAWRQAHEWERYKLEVALVSGTEMELHARPARTLWAVDHFVLEDFDPAGVAWQEMEWLKEGSPRYLAWSKSIAASYKGAKVHRLFLIDATLFGNGTEQDEAKLLSLFSTMAIQHRYLSQMDRGTKRGEVRFLLKDDATKIEKDYPDYCIIAHERRIYGGVVWKPQPRYVNENDTVLLEHLLALWERAEPFTTGFAPVKGKLLLQKTAIATAIARVEQLNDRDIQPRIAQVETWLTQDVLK